MVAYADTSFVVALYLSEATSRQAVEAARRLTEPLPITPFLLLELRNALNLSVKRGKIVSRERDVIWKNFENDISDGILVRTAVSSEAVYRIARELSDRHTQKLGVRSLDLLHLAAAKSLGAKVFFTFDQRQAEAGKIEGLKIKP